MLKIGKMDRSIILQRRTVTTNDYGEEIETWVNLTPLPIWAQMIPIRGGETYAAQQFVAESDTRWKIHYRRDAAPEDRLIYGRRIHEIVGVLEIGRREGLEIYTKATG